MSNAIRIVGTVKGCEEVSRRFMAHGDRIRNSVKKELMRIGTEAKNRAASAAPRSSGYRSPGSRKVGPLAKNISRKVTSGDAGMIRLSVRPLPFYALFVEGGVTRQPFRKNHTNKLGELGTLRKVVMNRGYVPGSKQRDGAREYLGYATVGAHQRHTAIRDDYGQVIGRRIQKIRERKVKAYTYKKTTIIPPRPFMYTAQAYLEYVAPTAINEAVAEALRES